VQADVRRKDLIVEGVCGIVEGLNPKLIRSQLEAFTHSSSSKSKASKKVGGRKVSAPVETEAPGESKA